MHRQQPAADLTSRRRGGRLPTGMHTTQRLRTPYKLWTITDLGNPAAPRLGAADGVRAPQSAYRACGRGTPPPEALESFSLPQLPFSPSLASGGVAQERESECAVGEDKLGQGCTCDMRALYKNGAAKGVGHMVVAG